MIRRIYRGRKRNRIRRLRRKVDNYVSLSRIGRYKSERSIVHMILKLESFGTKLIFKNVKTAMNISIFSSKAN